MKTGAINKFKLSLLPWIGFAATICLVLGIAVLAEIISFRHNQRLDLTPGKEYSLSAQTIKVLKKLDKNITITVFYKGGDRSRHEELFRRFLMYTKRI